MSIISIGIPIPDRSALPGQTGSGEEVNLQYATQNYCADSSNPSPTVATPAGGTFSYAPGGISGGANGQIVIANSTPGNYTVTYTVSGVGSANFPINITALDNATFSYSASAFCADASNQTPTITTPGGTFTAAPLFTGLLDTYTGSKIAYSLRKLDSNYTGNAIRVRRSSDNSEQDIGFTNNELDTTSLLSFVGSNNGFVTTWYDQSGNTNNATHSTAINQPSIVISGVINTLNNKPSIKFNGSVKLNITNNNFGQANSTPYTILTVSNMTSLPPDNAFFGGSHLFGIGSASNGYFTSYGDKIGFAWNSGNPVTHYTSGKPSQQVLSDTNVVSLNSTQLSIYTRGSGTNTLSSNNNTPVTNTQTANPYPYTQASIGASSGNNYSGSGVSPLVGNISECILWWTNFNSDRTDIKNNLNSFYTIY